jgi:hypothetical protein
MKTLIKRTLRSLPPRQFSIGFESRLDGMPKPERLKAVSLLASVLLQAAGMTSLAGERDDERH